MTENNNKLMPAKVINMSVLLMQGNVVLLNYYVISFNIIIIIKVEGKCNKEKLNEIKEDLFKLRKYTLS